MSAAHCSIYDGVAHDNYACVDTVINTCYNASVYKTMKDDTVRNSAYEAAISQLQITPGDLWLEIGCGAYLCLTNIAMRAHPEINILAIEANQSAYDSARTLAEKQNCDKKQLEVRNVRSDKLVEKRVVKVVLSELIGNIASQEGAAVFLKRYVNTHQVPRYAATFFAPCSLSNILKNVKPSSDIYNSSSFMVMDTALSKCNCSNKWAPAEHFDFYTGKYSEQRQEWEFEIAEDGKVDCFGLFVWVGFCNYQNRDRAFGQQSTSFPYQSALKFDTVPTHSFSSLQDDSTTASNWFNVIVKFPKAVHVSKGQMLKATSIFNYDKKTTEGKYIPSYSFEVGDQKFGIPFSHFAQDYESKS